MALPVSGLEELVENENYYSLLNASREVCFKVSISHMKNQFISVYFLVYLCYSNLFNATSVVLLCTAAVKLTLKVVFMWFYF